MIRESQAIDFIAEYCSCFCANVPTAAKNKWVGLLMQIAAEVKLKPVVVERSIKRCAENDLSPAWMRLRSSISIERALDAEKDCTDQGSIWDGYEAWLKVYREEGHGRKDLTAGIPEY